MKEQTKWISSFDCLHIGIIGAHVKIVIHLHQTRFIFHLAFLQFPLQLRLVGNGFHWVSPSFLVIS